jgi:sugar lactone lactonase YvrE
MVYQDGEGMMLEKNGWVVPTVMDNLIAKGEMPVTIGVFINPGVLMALSPDTQQNRYNRSYEYDALGDRYARFLTDEILPQVTKLYNISTDPNDRGIAGVSSGGIAAFNAAWNRPDQFHRVMTFVGSYGNLRGGDELASLIRKTEPKPLRVFLEDGTNDLNNYAGNWYINAQSMFSALQYAGYESNLSVGSEGHLSRHGGSILPDAMRWLWKDYPKPVAKPSLAVERGAYDFVQAGTDWELIGQGYKFADGAAADKAGNVFFTDRPNQKIYKIDLDGNVSLWKDDSGGPVGMVFGPDGRMYVGESVAKQVVSYAPDGTETVIATDINPNDLVVTAANNVYVTESLTHRVWFIDAKGNKRVVNEGTDTSGINYPNGVRTSPDGSLLMVSDTRNKWVWSFQIEADGSLADGEEFYRLETPDENSWSGGDGMIVDTLGYLYVTSRLGVQICDQPGKVQLILSKPQAGSQPSVAFGGADMQWLYVTSQDKVFRRRMVRTGMQPWGVLKPPVPRL